MQPFHVKEFSISSAGTGPHNMLQTHIYLYLIQDVIEQFKRTEEAADGR
jgi:hypothetical protein